MIGVELWPPCPLPNRGATHKVINTDHTRTAEHKKRRPKVVRCLAPPILLIPKLELWISMFKPNLITPETSEEALCTTHAMPNY